ncbi:hypothetical protein B0H13DRAFT_1874232 [Mycena leptocephala]|nr:hypothetical protein B0H13DRAFT_1874232 [Mycena leptocephala]
MTGVFSTSFARTAQCQRRALKCEYPAESRRGMRMKKSPAALVSGSGSGASAFSPAAGEGTPEGDAEADASSSAEPALTTNAPISGAAAPVPMPVSVSATPVPAATAAAAPTTATHRTADPQRAVNGGAGLVPEDRPFFPEQDRLPPPAENLAII